MRKIAYRQFQQHDVMLQSIGVVTRMRDGAGDFGGLFGAVVAGERVVAGGDGEGGSSAKNENMFFFRAIIHHTICVRHEVRRTFTRRELSRKTRSTLLDAVRN